MPIALFFSLNVISSLSIAFSNPIYLIFDFIIACVCIYVFCSCYFLFYGLLKGRECKPTLKDWIKINAFISFIFIVLMFLCSLGAIMVLSSPQIIDEVFKRMKSAQIAGQTPTKEQLLGMIKFFLYIVLPFCVLLLIHLIITFKLIKQNASVFSKE